MNYTETIDYLFTRLPQFSRLGSAAYKKDLTNIKALCKELNNPQQKFKTIHVGGTNGKGSVSHMLAAILQTAGYKTGLYTSPHLHDFRERIKINGEVVPKAFVVTFTEKIKPLIEIHEPSFFEITVAMAFDFFAQQQVDVAIIEVGLGGRLDSTNIITPELSVITNIGWDHMNMLGNSLPEIAGEKAGIIKEAVPVVIGEKQEEIENVFRKTATEKKAPLFFATEHFRVENFSLTPAKLSVSIQDINEETKESFDLDLSGIYQLKNICTVLQAVKLLKQNGWAIENECINKALQQTKSLTGLHGRWEVLNTKPTVVLEVAHNVNGVEQMLAHLSHLIYNKLHLIIGIVKDKDVSSVLNLLPKEATYYFTQAQIPRALSATDLQGAASKLDLNGNCFNTVNDALKNALQDACENDLIIVCGSIFLVAEVDKSLVKTEVY